LINCRRADIDKKSAAELHKNYFLCGKHFETNQFLNGLQNRLKCNVLVKQSSANHMLLSAALVTTEAGKPDDVHNDNGGIWDEISQEILHTDVCYEQGVIEIFTEAEESLISYLSGWLARKCGICADCATVLFKRLDDHSYCRRPIDDFAAVKRFVGSASVGLVEPGNELFTAVYVMEE